MTKTDRYRETLATLDDWVPFLLDESGLPGPRGNLELLYAVVSVGNRTRYDMFLAHDRPGGTAQTAAEFVVMCGIAGQGTLLAEGDRAVLEILRAYANHHQWRLREAVAMALQYFGRTDMDGLVAVAGDWARGTLYEARAAAAALCEPGLLAEDRHAVPVLSVLDCATRAITDAVDRNSDEFRVLKKGLSYCWSVALAAYPEKGQDRFAEWCHSTDKDISRIMRENLKKKRIQALGNQWIDEMRVLVE